jgi:hypothetical protein
VAPIAGTIYKYLTMAFLGLVVVEFFLAGLGVFNIASDATTTGTTLTASGFDQQFHAHLLLGDVIDLLAFVILGAALAARFDRRRLAIPAVLLVMVVVQAALAFTGPPELEALHPVVGLAILGLAVWAVRDTRSSAAPH